MRSYFQFQIFVVISLFFHIHFFAYEHKHDECLDNSDLHIRLRHTLNNCNSKFFEKKYVKYCKNLSDLILNLDTKHVSNDLFPNKTGRNRIHFDKGLKVWVKPRDSEYYLWEFSGILGLSAYFPPAVPFYNFGRLCSIQRHINNLNTGPWSLDNPRFWRAVPLVDYWKGNLATFILGMLDLHGANIGTTPDGQLYFFDLECAFVSNQPYVRPSSFGKYKTLDSSFASITFNWKQFDEPISKAQASEISAFIEAISEKLAYLESLSLDELETLFVLNAAVSSPLDSRIQSSLILIRDNFDLLKSLQIQEGQTFREKYFELFPLLGKHQKEIEMFGEKLWGRKGFGNAIWGLQRLIHVTWKQIDPKYLDELTNWVNSIFFLEDLND